jgi:hypothetical protein
MGAAFLGIHRLRAAKKSDERIRKIFWKSPRRSIFVRQHKLFGGKKIIWREKGFLPPLTRKYPTRVY